MKKTERTSRTQQEVESEQAELLELHEIKELVELIAAKEFTEFELVRGRFKLRLRKGGAADPVILVSPNIPGEAGETALGVVRASEQAATPPATATETPAAPPENLHVITSPIVGTFYRSSGPTAEAFVKEGDQITPGQTLCIIEAMKLMNEIQSEVSGVIVRVYAENGQPVEYGQALFDVKL